ncbi:MAG: hypothetical protein NVSMB55_01330 [Mycobacteriales bacterium]
MISGHLCRRAALAGATFVVAYMTALLLTPMPAEDSASSGAAIAAYVAPHRDRLLVSSVLYVASLLPLLAFVACIYRLARLAEGPEDWMMTAGLLGRSSV